MHRNEDTIFFPAILLRSKQENLSLSMADSQPVPPGEEGQIVELAVTLGFLGNLPPKKNQKLPPCQNFPLKNHEVSEVSLNLFSPETAHDSRWHSQDFSSWPLASMTHPPRWRHHHN